MSSFKKQVTAAQECKINVWDKIETVERWSTKIHQKVYFLTIIILTIISLSVISLVTVN